MRFAGKLFTALVSVLAAANLFAAGKAPHVVVLVWDGLRPDFVTEEDAPTLFKLARQKLSGRLLTEALVEPPAPAPSRQPLHFEATYRASTFLWRQYLDCSTVEGALYLDQGNGQQMPAR